MNTVTDSGSTASIWFIAATLKEDLPTLNVNMLSITTAILSLYNRGNACSVSLLGFGVQYLGKHLNKGAFIGIGVSVF